MSIFRKLEIGLVVLLLLTIVGLGLWNYHLHNAKEDAQQSFQVANGNAEAHETAAKEFKIVVQQKEEAQHALDKAIEANPVWSAEPVPSDVADLLRNPSGSARAVP